MIGCTFKNKEHFRNILNCFVGHLVTNVTQLVLVCSKSTAETQDQDLKSVQSYQWRQRNDIIWRRSVSLLIEQISYLLVFLLLTLNRQMLAVFNVCIDSWDAATRGILGKKRF